MNIKRDRKNERKNLLEKAQFDANTGTCHSVLSFLFVCATKQGAF